MVAPQTTRTRSAVLGVFGALACLVLLLLSPASAAPAAITGVQVRSDDQTLRLALTTDAALPSPVVTVLTDPPRLVLEYSGVDLAYNDGQPRVFPVRLDTIQSLKVAEQTDAPAGTRVVVVFATDVPLGDLTQHLVLVPATETGQMVVVGTQPFTLDQRESLSQGMAPVEYETKPLEAAPAAVIGKLIHEKLGAEHDRFRFAADGALAVPVITVDGPRLLCRFNGASFKLPPTAVDGNFQAPVDGAVVREFQIINEGNGGVLLLMTLDPPVGHTLRHNVLALGGHEVQLDIEFVALHDAPSEPTPAPGLPLPAPPAGDEPNGLSAEQIAVLAGGAEAQGLTITQIQYQPIDAGERFIIVGNAPFEPQVERLTFPDRQVLTVRGARIAIPSGYGDRYTIPLSSDLVQDVQVIQKSTEAGPEAQIFWRLNTSETRDVTVNVIPVDAQSFHLDFTPADRAGAPAPAIEPPTVEPEPEPVMEPPAAEPVIEVPVAEPQPELAAEPAVAEPTPALEPAMPPHGASVLVTRDVSDGTSRFTFNSTEPLVAEITTARFPNRILVAFYNRPIDFGGLQMGKTRFFKGAVASSLRLMPDTAAGTTIVQIALDRPLEEVNYTYSDQGMTGILEIVPKNGIVVPEPAPIEAPAPAVEPAPEPEPVVAEPEPTPVHSPTHLEINTTPAAEPEPTVEPEPESQGASEPVTVAAPVVAEPAVEPEPEPVAIEQPEPVAEPEPEPVIEAPAPAPSFPAIEDTTVTIEVMNTTLAEALNVLAQQGVFNYSIDESIPADQRVSLQVRAARLFVVLSALEANAGIEYKKRNGVYHFYMDAPEPVAIEAPEPAVEPVAEPAAEPAPVVEPPVVGDNGLTVDEQAAEDARIAAAAEEARIAEENRLAAERAEQARIAEENRLAVERAEDARIAEQNRILAEQAERDRIAAEQAEQNRLAAEAAAEPEPAIETPVVIPEPEPEPVLEIPVAEPEPPAPAPMPEPEPAITPADTTTGTVTGISARTEGNTDIFEIAYTGELQEPLVTWLNYPSQLALSFPQAKLDDAQKQTTIPTAAAHFDATKLWVGGGGNSDPAVRVSLYLKSGMTSAGLDYHLTMAPGVLTVAVAGEPTAAAPAAGSATTGSTTAGAYHAPERVAINDGGTTPPPTDGATVAATMAAANGDKPAAAAPPKRGRYFANVDTGMGTTLPVQEEPLVTIDLREALVADVLAIIGQEYNLDLVVDPSIKKAVNIRMTEKPLTQVFDQLAAQAGVMWFMDEGVFIFAPKNVIEANYKLAFGEIMVYEPQFASAQQLQQVLRQLGLVESRDVNILRSRSAGSGAANSADTATEKLIIKVSPRVRGEIESLLDQLDAAPVQIRLDVKILQVSQTAAKKSGIDWLIGNRGTTGTGSVGFSLQEKIPGTQVFDPITGDPIPQIGRPDFDFFSGFERDRQNQIQIQAVINYLETSGDAIVVSNPNLVITSGSSGNLFVGEQIPFRSTFQVSDFGRVTQRVANQNVGLTLQYAAKADMQNGLVSLRVSPNLSNLQALTDIGPRTSQNNFTTQIVIPSGESFIVAGLVNDSDRIQNNKIPILGDLPLLGNLFRSKSNTKDRSELVLIFTPIILDSFGNPLLFEDFQRNRELEARQ